MAVPAGPLTITSGASAALSISASCRNRCPTLRALTPKGLAPPKERAVTLPAEKRPSMVFFSSVSERSSTNWFSVSDTLCRSPRMSAVYSSSAGIPFFFRPASRWSGT